MQNNAKSSSSEIANFDNNFTDTDSDNHVTTDSTDRRNIIIQPFQKIKICNNIIHFFVNC